MEDKHIVIFGGTGRTGVAVAEALLERGAPVLLFLRASSVVPPALSGRVQEYRGNSSNFKSVQEATKQAYAAVICVGDSSLLSATTFRGDVTRAVTEAANADGCALRVIVVSALGARGSGHQLPWYIRHLALFALQQPLRDHDVQEEVVEALPPERRLVVRPVQLVDGAAQHNFHATADGVVPRMTITRADVAHFIVQQLLKADGWWGKFVALSAT